MKDMLKFPLLIVPFLKSAKSKCNDFKEAYMGWKGRFMSSFVLYISIILSFLLLPFLNNLLANAFGSKSIGSQLEILSTGASLFTFFALQITIGGKHPTIIKFLIGLGLVLCTTSFFVFRVVPAPVRPFLFLSAIVFFTLLLFFNDLKCSVDQKTGRTLAWATDLPLVVAIIILAFVIYCLNTREDNIIPDIDTFIGGALVLKLAYYNASYSFVKVFL